MKSFSTGSALLLLLSTLLTLNFIPKVKGACEPYTGEVCNFIVNSYNQGPTPLVSTLLAQPIIESLFVSQFVNLTLTGPALSVDCFMAASKYFCATNFPSCNGTETYKPCQSVCTNLLDKCTYLFTIAGQKSQLPTKEFCSTLPTSGCELMDTAVYTKPIVCEEPLVPNPFPGVYTDTCPGECCVPCPVQDNFYPKNAIRNVSIAIQILSCISFCGSIFVLIAYCSLKDKRQYPQILILFMCTTLTIAFLSTWLSIFAGRNNAHCNGVYPVNPGETNPICTAQGSLVVYGVLGSAGWFFFLVLNIHLNVVWRNQRLEDYYFIYHLVWILPLIPVIVVNVYKTFSLRTGIWCHPDTGPWIQATLLSPLAVILYPAFLINLVTLWKIFLVARERNAKIKTILKIQMRPFLFTFAVISILIAYSVYAQAIQGSAIIKITDWVYEWTVCVQSGHGQNECSRFSEAHVPKIGAIAFVESILHLMGIILFAFFGARLEIFQRVLHSVFPKWVDSFSMSSVYVNERGDKDREKTINESNSHLANADKTVHDLSVNPH